jgi:hypothetical protein
MINSDFRPQVGDTLDGDGVVMIADAIMRRRQNFPNEEMQMTIALVFLNIGSRFTPLECVGPEKWTGIKSDLPPSQEGPPVCPNGHTLEKGKPPVLGWVAFPDRPRG